MSGFETDESPAATVAFGEYVQAKTDQLTYLSQVLNEAMPILDHYDEPGGTNTKLIEAGRVDLIIVDPAEMMSVERPEEIKENCNNFLPNFRMAIGDRETSKVDIHNDPIVEPIPPTPEDVFALRDMPKIKNLDELDELRNSYNVLYGSNHARIPAFIRMLNLWPDFTANLVARMSQAEEKNRYDHFEAELFVAYQLMSRLVDQADPNVLRDGEIDDWYLCR